MDLILYTPTQPVIYLPYINQVYSGEKFGIKPFTPLQDALASEVDLNSMSYRRMHSWQSGNIGLA